MGCGCGGSKARQNALENQQQARRDAAAARGSTPPPTQTPGYYSGPKAEKKPA